MRRLCSRAPRTTMKFGSSALREMATGPVELRRLTGRNLSRTSVQCVIRKRDDSVKPPASTLEQRGQLALRVHLADDVAAAHQLPVDIELGIGRPARVLLQPLAQLLVG